jgi:hypothetical protein
MTKEGVEFLFTILTGLATTGTFLFLLFDRRPSCEIKLRISESQRSFPNINGARNMVSSPELFLTITNTGRVELYIAAVWINSETFKTSYYLRCNRVNRDTTTGSFALLPKRRTVQRIYLSDLIRESCPEDGKVSLLEIQAEIVLETGDKFHSKKLPIPAELLEAASKESLIQS